LLERRQTLAAFDARRAVPLSQCGHRWECDAKPIGSPHSRA
jgi:hypothetical protein